jgi:hypothetical protein
LSRLKSRQGSNCRRQELTFFPGPCERLRLLVNKSEELF